MKEIEIGEYIRFEDGEIGKVIDIKENPARVVYSEYGEIGLISEITKHSKNIIDLIEVGDYVNGYRIIEIHKPLAPDDETILDIGYGMAIFNDEVKSILTHEQHENNCYKVVV